MATINKRPESLQTIQEKVVKHADDGDGVKDGSDLEHYIHCPVESEPES